MAIYPYINTMKVKGKVTKGLQGPCYVKTHHKDIKSMVVKGDTKTYTPEVHTANVMCSLKKGLYIGQTKYGGALIMSLQDSYAANNNLFNQAYQNDIVEVHIIGWSGDLYGKELEVWDIIEIPWQKYCTKEVQCN